MEKLIITAALVGAEATVDQNPYIPMSAKEIGVDAEKAFLAGASIVHIHVRDKDNLPSQNKELYLAAIEEIKNRCNIIIQISTGGAVGMTPDERLAPISLKPEMATLTTGSVNFGGDVFLNTPFELESFAREFSKNNVMPEFEIFDVAMIQNAKDLHTKFFHELHMHFDLVMGVPGAIPATVNNLLHLVNQLPTESTWSVAGIGRHQLPMIGLGIILGGHVRVGLEDNLFYRKGELATNEKLVQRAKSLAKELGREIATPEEARKILNIDSGKNEKA